jgi:PilZ domain
MARRDQDLGERKSVRIEMHKPGFLIPAPDAPWIECTIVDVSDRGTCLEVGALPVPGIFGLSFTGGGEVLRVCRLVWRRGDRIGARFVTASELRQGFEPAGGQADLRRALTD